MTNLKRRICWTGTRQKGMVINGREEKTKGGREICEFIRKGSYVIALDHSIVYKSIEYNEANQIFSSLIELKKLLFYNSEFSRMYDIGQFLSHTLFSFIKLFSYIKNLVTSDEHIGRDYKDKYWYISQIHISQVGI